MEGLEATSCCKTEPALLPFRPSLLSKFPPWKEIPFGEGSSFFGGVPFGSEVPPRGDPFREGYSGPGGFPSGRAAPSGGKFPYGARFPPPGAVRQEVLCGSEVPYWGASLRGQFPSRGRFPAAR